MTRILIVDDNPSVRAALRMCFKMKTDWIVCGEAGNGDAAIAMAHSVKPDVVLLDYAMPVMNGLEAARILSALAPKCAILMYTMFASPDLSELARAAGGRAHGSPRMDCASSSSLKLLIFGAGFFQVGFQPLVRLLLCSLLLIGSARTTARP